MSLEEWSCKFDALLLQSFFCGMPLHSCLAVITVGFAACFFSGERTHAEDARLVPLPQKTPRDDKLAGSANQLRLGRRLFFDKRLSGNNKISCATCHVPKKSFSDQLAVSTGFDGKKLSRNTPTLLNVRLFRKSLMWDGRAQSLEQQAIMPIVSTVEMNQPIDALVAELNGVDDYQKLFIEAFGGSASKQRIAKALAVYQRTLRTKPSPFDRYLRGDREALSIDAERGLELFKGDAGCIQCHHGPLLSDEKFHRIGVNSKDLGRATITKRKEDKYRFRTPSLRNIARTGPYMHNGSMKTLEDVVTFYYRGIPASAPDGQPLDIQALSSNSFSEIADIVAFLESLTGEPVEVR